MKNILILGGSYFVGRVFTIMAASAGHALTLINRGRFSMERYGTKEELHFDRHDVQAPRSTMTRWWIFVAMNREMCVL